MTNSNSRPNLSCYLSRSAFKKSDEEICIAPCCTEKESQTFYMQITSPALGKLCKLQLDFCFLSYQELKPEGARGYDSLVSLEDSSKLFLLISILSVERNCLKIKLKSFFFKRTKRKKEISKSNFKVFLETFFSSPKFIAKMDKVFVWEIKKILCCTVYYSLCEYINFFI